MLQILLFALGIQSAEAVRLAMEPKNRVLLGASYIDGSEGISLGVESRLTQLIYINMGGFASIAPEPGNIESENKQDWIRLNHGIWAAPGWRIPHRYKKESWNWDIIFRGGFACVFSSDANRDDLMLFDPAALGGVDAYIQKDSFGLRWSSKLFFYQPELSKTLQGIQTQRLQSGLEVYWEWN